MSGTLCPAELVQVVLSAGRSSRMGEPKALLDFDGRSALSIVLGAARGIASRRVVVLSPDGELIREAHSRDFEDVEWVVNPEPNSEQIDSLACGLEALRGLAPGGGFFVHPVDFPLATQADYAALEQAFVEDIARDVEVFKPRPRGGSRHGHPILCRGELLDRFIAEARRGGTARDVIRTSAARSVEVENPGLTRDMDSPENYRELLEIYRSRGGGAFGLRSR